MRFESDRNVFCGLKNSELFMKLSHRYNRKDPAPGFRTALRQSVSTFVNRYAESFEALTRVGSPFGGSVLPTNGQSTGLTFADVADNKLVQVQRQVGELTRMVARLSDQVNQLSLQTPVSTGQPAMPAGRQSPRTDEIGINRYRSSQGKA